MSAGISFRDWAEVLDRDYDPDCDIPARLYCAYHAGDVNLTSSAIALADQWSRNENPERWEACMAWLRARGWPRPDRGSESQFEDDAMAFLKKIGKKRS